jgi:hypothetical protein
MIAAGYGAGGFMVYSQLIFINKGFFEPKIAVVATATPPNILAQSNYSNHFSWTNNFKNQYVLGIEARAAHQKKLELAVQVSNLRNQIYYDAKALPQQNKAGFWLLQASVKHEFTVWGWLNFSGYNALQYTTNSTTLRLPLWISSNAVYAGKRLKKGYTAYAGADVRYNANYFANGYQPATGVFYVQNNYKLQNYPILDLFAALQVSKVRIFVKLEHSNQYAFASTYYTTVFYPSTLFGVRGGVHWRFYN